MDSWIGINIFHDYHFGSFHVGCLPFNGKNPFGLEACKRNAEIRTEDPNRISRKGSVVSFERACFSEFPIQYGGRWIQKGLGTG
jgi:hypothetical protein